MANHPLVSVVIPAYNCEQFIEESVLSALNQTMKDLEIIAVDDASTDHTSSILQQLASQDSRIRVLHNDRNLAVANTRNRAFDEARGNYIAFLDGDDVWLPVKLEKQLCELADTGCDFCYTSYAFIDENRQVAGKPYLVPATVNLEQMIRENVIGCSTVLCKADVLKRYKMRPEYAHEDYVLWLELLRAGHQAVGILEPLMLYRVLKESRSWNKLHAAHNRWKVYREFLNFSVPQSLCTHFHYIVNGIKKHI